MNPHSASRSVRATRTWRVYTLRDLRRIDSQLRDGDLPCCPQCECALEARVDTRNATEAVLDAVAYDLDCARCRRFLPVVVHTGRSLRFLRMRRLATAVHHGARRLPRPRVVRFGPAEA